MKKIIVTTTINSVTPEIRKYDAMPDWELIVTGDRKTPEYKLERGRFVSWDEQQSKYPALCKLIGPDNTQRGRMLAFLEAHEAGADLVATIDDDCMPYADWPGTIFVGDSPVVQPFYKTDSLAFDPLMIVAGIPARGFPPQLTCEYFGSSVDAALISLVQENFWKGQLDVDAVWRVHGIDGNGTCSYVKRPFWSNAFSPINTQNTIIHRSVLKDHCGEIPFVGHVSDIWAGYLFQAYHPNSTLYAPATVRHWQDRSYASILKDLKEEIYSYEFALKYLEELRDLGPDRLSEFTTLPPEAVEAINLYRSYFK